MTTEDEGKFLVMVYSQHGIQAAIYFLSPLGNVFILQPDRKFLKNHTGTYSGEPCKFNPVQIKAKDLYIK